MTDRRAGSKQGPYVGKEPRARNDDGTWRKKRSSISSAHSNSLMWVASNEFHQEISESDIPGDEFISSIVWLRSALFLIRGHAGERHRKQWRCFFG